MANRKTKSKSGQRAKSTGFGFCYLIGVSDDAFLRKDECLDWSARRGTTAAGVDDITIFHLVELSMMSRN